MNIDMSELIEIIMQDEELNIKFYNYDALIASGYDTSLCRKEMKNIIENIVERILIYNELNDKDKEIRRKGKEYVMHVLEEIFAGKIGIKCI